MFLRHFKSESPFTSILPSNVTLCRLFTSNPNDDVHRVYALLTTTSSPEDLKHSLKSTGIFLSNEFIDQVLKRVRFGHANLSQTLEFFRYTERRKGFYHTSFSFDTMLYILGRSRMFDHVWDLLIEARRKDQSVITPRTVMIVLGRVAKVCSVRQTVEYFRKFKKIVPDYDTNCFNTLLRTLCQEKSMTDSRNVYHSLKHSFRPNLQTFNILLSGWKTSEDAELFLNEMKEMGVTPDVVTGMVDVYCKGREIEKAYKVLDEMRQRDLSPNVITYTCIIGGLGLIGQPDKGRDVLKEVKEYGVYPDVPAYNAAIRNFCIAKRLGNAYDLVDEMTSKGLSPNATTYNLFFKVFYWSNDLESSWNLYKRMMVEGCHPNTQSCMFLIRLFKRHEKVEMALKLWGDMVEKGFGSCTLVSDVLFDMLYDMGKLLEAEKCFLEMIEKGQKPSNVSFKRIKVLMELANTHEAIQKLTQKMDVFGRPTQVRERVMKPVAEMGGLDILLEHSLFMNMISKF